MSIVEARDLPHTERLNRDAALAGFAAQVVALATDVPARDIIGSNRRTAAVSRARQFAMYLAYVTFQWPLSRVGAAFGRDRTTAGYACRQIEDLRDDPRIDGELERLEACLRAAPDRGLRMRP